MLGGGAALPTALMQVIGDIAKVKPPLGQVFLAVPDQFPIVSFKVNLPAVPEKGGIQHQLLGVGQPFFVVGCTGPGVADIDVDTYVY